ncbi:MAG: 3-methyl-2-oxobutanoate hydroxymethyltransferase [Proteobacteria bacterium]|nr:3-methyl-2-oxobutanoate hydroxymethyltransferase [Pseudomonadota bacterium]
MERRVTVETLGEMKHLNEPITMLTCYDYPTARSMDDAGIEIIFIGDSVGTNVLGYDSPCDVTMDDMLHHTRAVRRGVKKGLVLVDMPYKSYETPEMALANARRFTDAGADMIKLEGGREIAGIIRFLAENNIAVMAHIGHTPQTFQEGGRVVVGITPEEAKGVYDDALELEAAGAMSVLLECVPAKVTEVITRALSVPTIGIGCGSECDGQVLVVNDLLGWNDHSLRIFKKYDEYYDRSKRHFQGYISDVKSRKFPGEENIFRIKQDAFDSFLTLTEAGSMA